MSRWRIAVLAVVLFGACAPPPPAAAPAPAAQVAPLELERPIPYPVVPPRAFREAIERGTRTPTGEPGPNYWQQYAAYRISANLDTQGRQLEGTAQIRYRNRSPDALRALAIHLHQNLHAPGVVRNEAQEVTGGMTVTRLTVDGQRLQETTGPTPGYQTEGTLLVVRPPAPVPAGGETTLELDWTLAIPQSGAGRMGWDADDLFFLAYWYPQMAVYDDLDGWHTDPYRGLAEFYMGYADYDVRLTVPEGWVLRATGELQNPQEVLPPTVIERLRRAEQSDEVVEILSPAEFGPGAATLRRPGGRLEWHFQADSVRDFSFSATRRSRWEAARAPVGDRTGDGQTNYARIETLYRETAPLWAEVTRYQQHALDFLSRYTAFPYPYPHMTAVEGANIIDGGMEFPMITLMGDYNVAGAAQLYAVTAHELAHMWIPMIVGSDERRYGWMDEGATSFAEAQARNAFFPGVDHEAESLLGYLRTAQIELEGPVMRWTDFHETFPGWINATYSKPAVLLATLRGLLGEETFLQGYRAFIRNWAYRHPSPWDLFNTFNTAAGRNLDWFWRSWYYETWALDHAVASVTEGSGGTTIVVEDLGEVPMPARLTITRADGEVLRREVPVETWLSGVRTATVTVPPGSPVVRVVIDAEGHFPDLDRENNIWER